ncbi:histone-binding protein N1/N2-like [Aulostomus maculatus]
MEVANKLIGDGKKKLVMGKVVEAVGALQEACGLLAEKFGDTADECGEAFFWCGKALLDLARMENSVLGNALEGVPEGEDDEKPKDSNVESTENVDERTRDELRVQVYDAMAENKNKEKVEGELSANGEQKREEGGEEEEDVKESKLDENEDKNNKVVEEEPSNKEEKVVDKPEEEAGEDEGDEEEDDDKADMEGDEEEKDEGANDCNAAAAAAAADKVGDEEEEEEEVGNLQLAWEMLEVAKVIYQRKDAKEDQLMAAQAHLKLGEVSAESGNYTQALEDFQACLKLQLKHLDADSRLLAETHYQLGITFSLNLQYKEAIEELNSSIAVIKSRLETLMGLTSQVSGTEELLDERKEMEELKALLPEIQEKVEDATEGLKMVSSDIEAMKDLLDGGTTPSVFAGSTGENGDASSIPTPNGASAKVSSSGGGITTTPVSDISHLVRKKRKPEESPRKEGMVKKLKQNVAQTIGVHSNGVNKINGDTNSMEEER